MSYSLDALQDSYCYPETSVLINKLNIRNQKDLDKAEKMSVLLHTVETEQRPPCEPFTFDFYCNLHKTLFSDIYDWAGQIRKTDISKSGTNFCPYNEIAQMGKAKFDYLQKENYFCGLGREQYIKELSDFYNDLNMLHPFREGNGRTQRLFFSLLVQRKGYFLDLSEEDLSLLAVATIQAAHGVMDYLEEFFNNSIK